MLSCPVHNFAVCLIYPINLFWWIKILVLVLVNYAFKLLGNFHPWLFNLVIYILVIQYLQRQSFLIIESTRTEICCWITIFVNAGNPNFVGLTSDKLILSFALDLASHLCCLICDFFSFFFFFVVLKIYLRLHCCFWEKCELLNVVTRVLRASTSKCSFKTFIKIQHIVSFEQINPHYINYYQVCTLVKHGYLFLYIISLGT